MEDSLNRETVQQAKLIKELQAHTSILSIEIENFKRKKSPLPISTSKPKISEAINPEEGGIRDSDDDKLPRNNKSLFEELHANTPSMENIKMNTLKTVPRVTNIQIKQQILIVGDNQAQDMDMLLKSLLISSKYNILSILKPNALLDDVADVLVLTKDFSLRDYDLVLGDTEEKYVSLSNHPTSYDEDPHDVFEETSKVALTNGEKSVEHREVRKQTNALRNAFKRANETEEQRKLRNRVNAIRNANRRANETNEERKERLYKNALRTAIRRSRESDDQQKLRRQKNASRAAYRRSIETTDQKIARRLKDKERSAERRRRETDTQSTIRKYNDAVRAALRRSNETKDQKRERKLCDVVRAAQRRSNETEEERQKRLKSDKERSAARRSHRKMFDQMQLTTKPFLDHSLEPYLKLNVDHQGCFTETGLSENELNNQAEWTNSNVHRFENSNANNFSIDHLPSENNRKFTNESLWCT
ncbi:hypothetical protein FQA39_LY17485 [Lamprigera yunnana]|nr:hypothetical protein FQA39_LY17485 [Lamprigera yunnana]